MAHIDFPHTQWAYYIVVFTSCVAVLGLSIAIRMLTILLRVQKERSALSEENDRLKQRELGYKRLLYWTVHKFENTSHKDK